MNYLLNKIMQEINFEHMDRKRVDAMCHYMKTRHVGTEAFQYLRERVVKDFEEIKYFPSSQPNNVDQQR